ncbi:MAG: hypothetical protein A3C43_04120 [Candidatus Schekmanbacteria bacterium RIFCSPHIGHO2_02_FULL_38_11]|uniref:Doubled CXXCH motif domain-containing protein n=1 Tax=Candidatus Schekmanbacteria bacterium RIFCSPLOWO2_12_FULL_38_15 TaxID=1817883 RepID=A0A1F7SHA4_9BACT|nr:MAG: hypothetical protein A3H37_05695 [Candidatus Schekmanbacteria bacterium RIFCSPLOWO2_02_FULL_38_14]OGL52547.1 MAG: hypothetical protein A3G31_11255 [Candidatus Schekmanbacteria bacterium RIFCSPLOWO2_12_FULL_38_15]OGL54366.1 MAG: hypothetical protein A3C43_04120 [Candidatus Schekmanbacteria bacterium RIFCSPHIGHO2_02_FULL_38_11]
MLKNFPVAMFLMILIIFLPLKASSQTAGVSNEECFGCHEDKSLSRKSATGEEILLFVEGKEFNRSVHKNVRCIYCHDDLKDIKDFPHKESLKKVECKTCHEKEFASFAQSVHGREFIKGDRNVPGCATCHGKHYILCADDPECSTSPAKQIKTCTKCHEDQRIVKKYNLPGIEFIKSYEKSIHGRAITEKGLIVSAVCSDCHGAHEIKPADDPKSLKNKANIPKVCARCHDSVYSQYVESIHGKAILSGIKDSPVCTDCHGEHTIAASSEPSSKVAPKNIPETCSVCHSDVKLTEKYGIPGARYKTYLDSYHGMASKFGEVTVANCASCHGYHNILPSSDKNSLINKDNLPKTCGKCHPGATGKFAIGKIHVEAKKESSLGKYYVRQFYIWFISILIVCFVSYVALELYGYFRRKR